MFLQNHPKRNVGGSLRVGVVGLGAGTLAVYGRPGDYFRYYEINPAVVELSVGEWKGRLQDAKIDSVG